MADKRTLQNFIDGRFVEPTDGGYADRPLRAALARWAVRASAARSR